MNLITLLIRKNNELASFLRCSEELSTHLEHGNWDQLTHFENQRSLSLKTILQYDQSISIAVDSTSKEVIETIRDLVQISEKLLAQVKAVDHRIMVLIENEQNRLRNQLSESDRNRSLLKKFKSNWVTHSGEKLDDKL